MAKIKDIDKLWKEKLLAIRPKQLSKEAWDKLYFGSPLESNEEIITGISYKPYSLHTPEEMNESNKRTDWALSFQRELENFPSAGNDDAINYSAMVLFFNQEGIGWGTEIYLNVLRTDQREHIVKKYRKALDIHNRRKAVISAYALRFTDFCRLNAESRRLNKRVSEQFKELVKWKRNRAP